MSGSSRFAQLALSLGVLATFASIGAPPARANCKGGLCLVIESNIKNPKYIHFHFTTTASPFTHFNMRYRGSQKQLKRTGGGASVVTYVPRRSNDSVSAQVCNRGGLSLSSKCLPWQTFALPEPAPAAKEKPKAARWVAIAVDGKGRWGYAHNHATAAQARAAALKGCGSGCRIESAAQNRCFAFAESRRGGYWYGVSIGPTQNSVVSGARGGCAAGAPANSCRIVKTVCG